MFVEDAVVEVEETEKKKKTTDDIRMLPAPKDMKLTEATEG